jgi:ribosome-associated translation inhibitor RaiA
MQVKVNSRALPVTEQTRAYLEYRLFCELVPFSGEVVQIDVELGKSGADERTTIHCRAVASLMSGEAVEALAAGAHLYAAIDRTSRLLGARVSACGHAEPRTRESGARRQRRSAVGVGPQRHWNMLEELP